MTREEFMLRKEEIQDLMKETRTREARECEEIDDMQIRQIHLMKEQYDAQRERLKKECRDRCDKIRAKYRKERQRLFLQDMELVAAWRNQLGKEGGEV